VELAVGFRRFRGRIVDALVADSGTKPDEEMVRSMRGFEGSSGIMALRGGERTPAQ
jgi:hypothetical protein